MVEVADYITVGDSEIVYIFRTEIDENETPLLIKQVAINELPTLLSLDVEDFVPPRIIEFPDEGLDVFARLSRTGNLTRQKEDFESKSVVVKAGSTVRLVIDQPVSETSEP